MLNSPNYVYSPPVYSQEEPELLNWFEDEFPDYYYKNTNGPSFGAHTDEKLTTEDNSIKPITVKHTVTIEEIDEEEEQRETLDLDEPRVFPKTAEA